MKKIVITGGHLPPALALIEEIERDKEEWQVFYFGVKHSFEASSALSFEYTELKNHPTIKFIPLVTGRLQRKFTLHTIPSLFKIPIGLVLSAFWLLKIKPTVIVSFGGYISVPVVITGWLLGIPSVTHEQTNSVGLANKINSLFVRKIALSFPNGKSKKTVLTGNPVLKNLFDLKTDHQSEISKVVLEAKKPILFISGGKTGSKTINNTIRKAKAELKKNFFIIHQTGAEAEKKETDYYPVKFIKSDLFPWILKKSAIVISRSGANVVCYLACLKKKAVLIPIPGTSGNEQEKNAEFLKTIGLAEVIPQEKLTEEKLIKTINHFYTQKEKIAYPKWWQKVNPQKASFRLWQLVKNEI